MQLVKKFPAFHGTRRLITALTSVRQLSLSWACPYTHLLKIHPNIIHPSTPRSPHWSPSLRFPQQKPIHPPLLKYTHRYSTPLLINVGNKKRMNTFVRKYHGGLVSTEKEETQQLWTSPMKTEHISKSINCSGSYCYFVRTVILTLHSIQHGKKHRQF